MTKNPDPSEHPPRHPHELVWRCLKCGEVIDRGERIPQGCPTCGAPVTELVLIEED